MLGEELKSSDKLSDLFPPPEKYQYAIIVLIEEMPLLKRYWRLPVLFCILGNTFCNYDPEFILKLVYENLEQGDLFLFDADLYQPGTRKKRQNLPGNLSWAYIPQEKMLFLICIPCLSMEWILMILTSSFCSCI